MPTTTITENRRARRRANATLIALFALLATACSPGLQTLRGGSAATAPTTPTERQVVNSVNQFRAAHGLRALQVEWNLQNKARLWSAWMAAGHCGRDARGVPLICHSSLPSGITVHWSQLEENVGYASPRTAVGAIMTGFEHSPEHAANMLNTRIADIGVGVAYSGNFVYVTEEFMAP